MYVAAHSIVFSPVTFSSHEMEPKFESFHLVSITLRSSTIFPLTQNKHTLSALPPIIKIPDDHQGSVEVTPHFLMVTLVTTFP